MVVVNIVRKNYKESYKNKTKTKKKEKLNLKVEEGTVINEENQLMSASYLVTVDDYDTMSNPRLIDRAVFNQLQYKNNSIKMSETAQISESEYGTEFKTPEYPLKFLAGLLDVNLFHYDCCEMVGLDCVKNGYDVVKNGVDTAQLNEAKVELQEWLNNLPTPILDMFQETIMDYEAIGCGGVEIIREQSLLSPIVDFNHLKVVNCKLHSDDKRVLMEMGGKKVWFFLYGTNYDEDNRMMYLNRHTGEWSYESFGVDDDAHELLWWREYKTGCNSYGSARITKALDILELEIGRTNFNIKFFENYGLPAFAVYITGNFRDEEMNRYLPDGSENPDFDVTKTLRYRLAQQIEEVIKNPHSAVVLSLPTTVGAGEVKVNFVPLSTDIKEASFRMMRQDNKDDICSVHKISSNLVGASKTGALGGNVLEAETKVYQENKIQPIQKVFTNPFNKLIHDEVGVTFQYNNDGLSFKLLELLKQDMDIELDRVLKEIENGLITIYDGQVKLSKTLNIIPDEDEPLLREYFYKGRPLQDYFYGSSTGVVDDMSLRQLEYQLGGVVKNARKSRSLKSVKSNANKGTINYIKQKLRG